MSKFVLFINVLTVCAHLLQPPDVM